MNVTREQTLALVSRVPRTASEIYREAEAIDADQRLSARHRNARRRLGRCLEQLAHDGLVRREVVRGERHQPWVCFWR